MEIEQGITYSIEIWYDYKGHAWNKYDFVGKSTNTKPTGTMCNGSTFFEMDTTKCFMWDSTDWLEI